jgi:hypothetical protein
VGGTPTDHPNIFMETDRLVKSPEEIMKEALVEDGWTPEQIAAWENDLDDLADMFFDI